MTRQTGGRQTGPQHSGTQQPAHRRPVRIGLTGPIGCGKSTVARWLAELGAAVIDADDVTREVMGPGQPVLGPIFERFGPAIRRSDGTLDRAALGRIVFADPAAMRDLEAIVHPAIRPALEAKLSALDAGTSPAVVLEAIKLVEAGYANECDEVWLVTCEAATQRARLIARGLDPDVADQRIAAQADLATRLAPLTSRLVCTEGPAETVRARVTSLYESVLRAEGNEPSSQTSRGG